MKFFILTSLLLIISSTSFAATCTTDICDVPAGGSTKIYRHGICYTFASTRADKVMIPTKTQPEYQSFIDAVTATTVANVTKTACTPILPTFRAFKEYSTSGSSTHHVTLPTGTLAGDLLIFEVFENTSTNYTNNPPAGSTSIGINYIIDSSYRNSAWYKLVSAAEVTAGYITMTRTGTFGNMYYGLVSYKDVDQVTPVANTTINTATSGSTITYLGANVTTGTSLIITWGEDGSPPGVPTGFTGNASMSTQGARVSSKAAAGVGASGNFTGTNPSAGWAGLLVIANPGY